VAYLYGLQKHGIKLGLETIDEMLAALGRPHERYPSFHIGGTNGKGSTAAMAASVLRAAGYRVGLYTSPHLVDYRERIRVNGDLVSEAQVVDLVQRVRQAAGRRLEPTFFEFNTAMAFQHFAGANIDVAVVEVGMGGRFDATNVLRPLVSCVTTVALDHQEHLGHSLRSIAIEKAGIIKEAVPIVSGRLDPEADQALAEVSAERRAPRLRLGEEFRAVGDSNDAFGYHSTARMLESLSCPLAGAHQLENAVCAIAMLDAARSMGFRVSDEAIRGGMRRVEWEGRLEIVERNPLVVLDGAHNPAAAQVIARYLAAYRRSNPDSLVHLVVGMMRDKDLSGFLARICPVADRLLLTRVDLPRAATIEELRAALPAAVPPNEAAPSVAEALDQARRTAAPRDLICVTGSLMLVGAVKAWLRGCHLSPISG
jgi:dihydrofolate synthase/folylpolyglutamate synthase